MQIIKRLLGWQISSRGLDTRIGQAVLFAVGFLILVFGILKLTSMKLTQLELFFGVMLVVTLFLLCIALGLLLELIRAVKSIRKG